MRILVILFSVVLQLTTGQFPFDHDPFGIPDMSFTISIDMDALDKAIQADLAIANAFRADQQQYQTQFDVPYKIAITTIATDIIEYLAVSPVPSTVDEGRAIVDNLNAKSQIFSNNIGTASTLSNARREQLDQKVVALVAQGAATEQQLVQNAAQIDAANQEIMNGFGRINDMGKSSYAALTGVQEAEKVLADRIEAVEKARRCLGGCRFILCKKACGVINGGGIDSAKDDSNRAKTELTASQARVATLQAAQAQLVQQQADLTKAKTGLESTKNDLTSQLASLNSVRDSVVNVDTALKALIVHVQTLFGKSQVLADVVKHMIDMEAIVNPLTAIADQIVGRDTTNADDIAYLNAMKQKISANLPLVQQKLPQYALIV